MHLSSHFSPQGCPQSLPLLLLSTQSSPSLNSVLPVSRDFSNTFTGSICGLIQHKLIFPTSEVWRWQCELITQKPALLTNLFPVYLVLSLLGSSPRSLLFLWSLPDHPAQGRAPFIYKKLQCTINSTLGHQDQN